RTHCGHPLPREASVFSEPTKNSPAARDLSRGNACSADLRREAARPLRKTAFLRTKVRAPFSRAAITLTRYGGEGRGEGGRVTGHSTSTGASTALKVVAWVGAITALFAALIAVAQTDIKRILAYSTVSQLGYMMIGLG